MNGILKQIAEVAIETVWPTRCAVCDMQGEYVLCPSCASKLEVIDAQRACVRCGAPYGRIQCTECNDVMLSSSGINEIPFSKMSHSVVLDEAARKIITVYKDSDERRLVHEIAKIMSRSISPDHLSKRYVLTFIPATKEAFRRRGFDHCEEIASSLSSICGLQVASVFERPQSSDQRKLDRQGRIQNMASRLRVRPNIKLPDKVLLIDDVCTTGATIYSASDTLRKCGVKEIQALTFALT